MFRNMKIRLRLMLSFGALCILLVMATLTALHGLSGMGDASNALYQRSVKGGEYLAQAQNAVWELRYGIAQYLALTDPAARRKIIDDSPKRAATLHEAIAQYEEVNVHPEVLSKLDETKQAIERYLDARTKTLQFFDEGKLEDAAAFRASTTTPAGGAMVKAVGELVKANTMASQSNYDDAIKIQHDAKNWLYAFAAISVIVSALLSVMVIRSLMRQLGGEPAYAAETVTKIAAGDLTVQVQISAGDTTSMLAAIKNMTVKLSHIIGEVRGTADTVANASQEINATAQSMSQATNEQAASVEETSAAIEQMGASIKQNSENAKVTDGIAGQAAKQASASSNMK